MTDRPAGERRAAWPARSAVVLALALLGRFAFAGPADAAPRDNAVIVDSGSTNTLGYKIEVWSDGSASVTPQNKAGIAQGAVKTFTVSAATASKFFADLQAARSGNATGSGCIKSASFGTATHVTWQGWTSPDLDCPPLNALVAALVHDVGEIRQASGVSSQVMHGPVMVPQPAPTQPE